MRARRRSSSSRLVRGTAAAGADGLTCLKGANLIGTSLPHPKLDTTADAFASAFDAGGSCLLPGCPAATAAERGAVGQYRPGETAVRLAARGRLQRDGHFVTGLEGIPAVAGSVDAVRRL